MDMLFHWSAPFLKVEVGALSYLSLKRCAAAASTMHVVQYLCQTRCTAKLLTLNEAARSSSKECQKVSERIPTLLVNFDSDVKLASAEASAPRKAAMFSSRRTLSRLTRLNASAQQRWPYCTY
jgi:hypothetical protein